MAKYMRTNGVWKEIPCFRCWKLENKRTAICQHYSQLFSIFWNQDFGDQCATTNTLNLESQPVMHMIFSCQVQTPRNSKSKKTVTKRQHNVTQPDCTTLSYTFKYIYHPLYALWRQQHALFLSWCVLLFVSFLNSPMPMQAGSSSGNWL